MAIFLKLISCSTVVQYKFHIAISFIVFLVSFSEIRRSKGRIGFYKPQNLEKAILAVITGKLNQSQAADKFDVTQSTISRRLRKMKSQLSQEFPIEQSQLGTQPNLKPP